MRLGVRVGLDLQRSARELRAHGVVRAAFGGRGELRVQRLERERSTRGADLRRGAERVQQRLVHARSFR